jgi:hypothetical protein
MRALIALVVAVMLGACAVHRAVPLGSIDFGLAGVEGFRDTTAAIRLLGARFECLRMPDAHRVSQPSDSADIGFKYDGLLLMFGCDGQLKAIAIADSARATARGLRVSDDTSRVRALYGAPDPKPTGETWWYTEGRGGTTMSVWAPDGVVRRILLIRIPAR